MGFASKILTSIHGRALGIQALSSAESGSGNGTQRFLVGEVADIRRDVSTAETTSVNLKAHGVSHLGTTSTGTGSSAVYHLDPPIPGVKKTIVMSCGASDGPVYIATVSSETISSTAGSTYTVMKFSTRGVIELMGITTARWFAMMGSFGPTLSETT
jgi:hypothetical protein